MEYKTEIADVGEKMQYCVHELNDNTVRFAVNYQGMISEEVMGQAMLMVINSVDILHASFVVEGRKVYWKINKDVTLQDCFLYLREEDNPVQLMHQALIKPVKPEGKAQMFCTLIHSKEESILILTISHLCVDGSDGKYILLKLLQAYRLLMENGERKEFHIKNGSRSVSQVYANCSRREYLTAMVPKLSKIKSEFPFTEEQGDAQIVIKTIPAMVMEAARKKGKGLQATVNDLLITACYKAYAQLGQVDGNEAMSILAMMDLRCHCIENKSSGLCNLSGPMSTELIQGADKGFEEILAEVVKQTKKEKENPIAGLHGMPLLHIFTEKIPFPLLLKIAKKVYGNFPIGMTNLGNLEAKELMLPGNTPKGCIFAGPLKKKPGMQIAAVGIDGEVTLACIGEFGNTDAEKIKWMLRAMVRILQEFGEDSD